MGRPPLHLIRTRVSLDAETLARLDALVGEKGRAPFVRNAVKQMLDAVDFSRKLEAEAKGRDE